MADRFWVGSGASWTTADSTPWSTSSGGAGGASAPTSSDNVYFDASSGDCVWVTGSGIAKEVNNINFTGYTGTFSSGLGGDPVSSLNIYGNLTFGSGMNLTATKIEFKFTATSTGKTITTNGINIPRGGTRTLTFDGVGGGWTLQDTLSTNGQVVLTNGTLNFNNQNVTMRNFSSSNSNTRTLTMGSGTINLTYTGGGSIWDISTSTNLTLTANTSTVKLTGVLEAVATFDGGGKTYYNFWNNTTGAYSVTISGSNTFTDLRIDAGRSQSFTAGTTQTVTTFTCNGTSGNLVTLASSTPGSTWTISDSTGTNTVSYTSITDSIATGGATWDADDGTNVNGGNNVGWLFPGFTNPTNAYLSDNIYATVTSASGDITIQLSGDGGASYSTGLTKTFTGVEGSQSYGNGATELWGTTWTGDNVDDTSFRVKVTAGGKSQIYKTYGFAIGASTIITGIEVAVEAKWDGSTVSIDYIPVRIAYGTSTSPVEAGSVAYDSTLNKLTYWNGAAWTYPGAGDVTGPSSSVDSEIALFSSTTGKVLKRASTTGVLKAASGVIAAAVAGTDYYNPGGTDVAVTDGGTGASTAGGAATNLGLGTGDNPQFTAVNVGHATDTTVARVSAGVISVEGVTVPTISSTDTLTNKTLTTPTIAQINNSSEPGVKLQLRTQTDNSNSIASATTAGLIIQQGWIQIIGDGTGTIEDTVTFPTAFTTVMGVMIGLAGVKASVASSVTDLTTAMAGGVGWSAASSSVTTTNFLLTIARNTGNFTATSYYGASWIAWGV